MGSLPEVMGTWFQGTWIVTRYPRFIRSGSRDFRDVTLASNGTIFWIGRHAFVIDLWPDKDSHVKETC